MTPTKPTATFLSADGVIALDEHTATLTASIDGRHLVARFPCGRVGLLHPGESAETDAIYVEITESRARQYIGTEISPKQYHSAPQQAVA